MTTTPQVDSLLSHTGLVGTQVALLSFVSLGIEGCGSWKCSWPQGAPAELVTEMELEHQQVHTLVLGGLRWCLGMSLSLTTSWCPLWASTAAPSLGQLEVSSHPPNLSLISPISSLYVKGGGDGTCFWSCLLWGQY